MRELKHEVLEKPLFQKSLYSSLLKSKFKLKNYFCTILKKLPCAKKVKHCDIISV